MSRVANWNKVREGGGSEAVQRVLALAGVLAPVMFFLLLSVAGLLRPGYNPIRQFGSLLEAGPHAWLVHADFITVGVLEAAFAYGLQRGIERGRFTSRSAVGPILIAVAGCGMILIGIFSTGSMHGRAVKLHTYALVVAYMAIVPRLWQDQRWRRYAPYSIIAAVLALIPWIGLMWLNTPQALGPVIGLVQRLHYAILFGWLEVMAVQLLRLSAGMHQSPEMHRPQAVAR